MTVNWLDAPEDHDYDAASDFLTMLATKNEVAATVAALKGAKSTTRKAKDILRAAQLPLLPESNTHVRSDLDKVGQGAKLSPILLVRGEIHAGVPLQIADGYHRVCASYLTDENTDVPCRLVSWQS
jgi:hypothetical protein